MKQLLIISGFLVTVLLANMPVSLANTGGAELDRYQFPKLEAVDRMHRYTIKGWHYVDARSIIVDASPSTSYLLILNREERDFRFAETVSFTSTASNIYAGFDSVRPIQRRWITIPVTIMKIYKLNGRADRDAVREQIRAD
ncbi:MAG: hypothetical protein HOM55_11295 [Proteobacteria bacterium]|jgi:hypothetical protein|nr:hypothetical protein [Pseudomonadota bacterium]